MSHLIQWDTKVTIGGTQQLTVSRRLSVEAYDSIEVEVSGGDTDKEVNVQPGGAGQVSFLVIASDHYSVDTTHQLTYKMNAAANPPNNVDQPQVLCGQGAVALLDPAPTTLFFSSTLTENATVRILVGRDATP